MRRDGGLFFVSDIDETLRCNRCPRGAPVPGAPDLLRAVHRLGVPIVYLTAARRRAFRAVNRRFLRRHRFPPGLLLDRGSGDTRPNAVFKADVLDRLRDAHPNAALVCLGDNETGDAVAYPGRCRRCYVRVVRDWVPGDNAPPRRDALAELPGGVHNGYDRATIRAIVQDVRRRLHGHRPAGAVL